LRLTADCFEAFGGSSEVVEDLQRVARIDLGALRANYAELLRRAQGRALIAVVKADAYGHGAVSVSRALVDAGCATLAVFTVDEGRELREAGIEEASILVLSAVTGNSEIDAALEFGFTLVLHHRAQLERVSQVAVRAGRVLDVHVEVDTGMCRMGVSSAQAVAFISEASATPGLRLTGVFTHLARADEEDLAPTRAQLALFAELLAQLHHRGIDPGLVHIANSAGILASEALPEVLAGAGAVRPGLSLYGASPAPHLDTAALRPVMSVAARVSQLRDVKAGEVVGYGATHRFSTATRVATLPIGYADGVPRCLGNRGKVRFALGERPIVGRVSMDSITIDVGDADIAIGDEGLLFGSSSVGALPVEAVAESAGTISYELLVRVGRRVPRLYL